jgi:predicted ATPase
VWVVARYVLTGAPGSGKTALLRALQRRGHGVVSEAATDVISSHQAHGVDEPWLREGFLDQVVSLQRLRQTTQPEPSVRVQFYDRSPLCTLALAHFLHRRVSPLLAEEVDRVVREQVYEPAVFLVRPLGFIKPTAARRISYSDSLAFETMHRAVYRQHGFTLIDVPAALVTSRVAVIEQHTGPT